MFTKPLDDGHGSRTAAVDPVSPRAVAVQAEERTHVHAEHGSGAANFARIHSLRRSLELPSWSMIRKNGNRFSEKIMLKQRDEIMIRFNPIGS